MKAVGIGASEIEIEYEDGCEEVCAFKDRMGIEIARLKSGSEEAVSLRNELYRIGKKKLRVNLSGADYELKVNVFESFGENEIRKDLGYTQKEFASELQISQQNLKFN